MKYLNYNKHDFLNVKQNTSYPRIGRFLKLGSNFWLEEPKGRDHWEDLGIGGRITLS